MVKERASIFDDVAELDVSGFEPKSIPDKFAPAKEEVRAVAEAANFRSREAKPLKATKPAEGPPRLQRRYRTGRNIQLNLKASRETLDVFYAISDANGWVLGETLERAVEALQKELDKDKRAHSITGKQNS